MYTSQLSYSFKLSFTVQLFMYYTGRVLKQEWKTFKEETFVRSQLQHYEQQVLRLTRIDNSPQNILSRQEVLAINPACQKFNAV